MLKINNNEFQVSNSELNFRSRNYQGQTIVSIQGVMGFYPRQIGEQIVNGTIEFVFDTSSFISLDELSNQTYEEGKLELALSKNGLWERETIYNVVAAFGERNGNKIPVKISLEKHGIAIDVELVMVSLYTTSTSEEQLKKSFNMNDFYEIPIRKKIQDHEVLKYIVKAE